MGPWLENALVAAIPLLGRTLPLLGYVLVSSERTAMWRIGWAGGLFAGYAAADAVAPSAGFLLVDVALSNAWLLIAAVALHGCARCLSRPRRLGRVLDSCLSAGAGLVLPLSLFPREMWPLVGPMGWEYSLSAYSYLQRTRRRPLGSVGDCLFFLLVNPNLVFSGRLTRVGRTSSLKAAFRVFGGYFAIFAAVSLGRAAEGQVVDEFIVVLLFLAVQYGTHSGRASQDVGMLKLVGYDIPERYHYPFSAKSPQDFWSRWNTYVGAWAKEYLFLPATRAARHRGVPRRFAVAIAAIATFAAVGVLHEPIALWGSGIAPLGFTSWFLLNGVLLVMWRGATPASPARSSGQRTIASTAAMAIATVTMAYMATKFLR